MDGVFMNAKKLKVVQYNLEFGGKDRFVNVLGFFKYKDNGNIYVLYCDENPKYSIIYYGAGHVRGDNVLCMKCKSTEEAEIIKEYIFKVVKEEDLSQFNMLPLDEVVGIELIGTDKIEVKPEVIELLINKSSLNEKKQVETKEEVSKNSGEIQEKKGIKEKKKKKSGKTLMLLLLFLIVGGVFLYFTQIPTNDSEVVKKIICNKKCPHDELAANVEEVNTYNFNVKDMLQYVDVEKDYQFSKEEYQDFIIRGVYYKYLPSDEKNGGYKKDDINYTFKIMYKEEINTSYSEPKTYEEVLSYYKNEGYTCREEIE